MNSTPAPLLPRPPAWAVVLAFALLYVSWGTTYFAIKLGVQDLPPALFGGCRVSAAGWVLLGYLAWRGEPLRLGCRDLLGIALTGGFLFVGGNGLITMGQKHIDSGVASILAATTPLWLAFLETAWPWGERLTLRGWLGLLAGLCGVLLLVLRDSSSLGTSTALWLVLGSALCWAIGSFILRYRRSGVSLLASAAWQMALGGGGLVAVGLLLGEAQLLTPDRFTLRATGAFFYLLVVGSLIGFVAFNWLLGHVSAPLVGTYAYVNPVVAILIGALLGGEPITAQIVGGMVVILVGVALVRAGGIRPRPEESASQPGDGALQVERPAVDLGKPLSDSRHSMEALRPR